MAAEASWGPANGGRIIQRDSSSKKILDQGRLRLMCITTAFALSFSAIACRLVDITVHKKIGDSAVAVPVAPVRADMAQDDVTAPLPLARGDIVDRNGEVLATTLSTQSLFANPQDLSNVEDAARRIAKALPDLNAAELAKKLDKDNSFVWIKRNLTPKEQKLVNNLGIPGLYFQPEQKRVYPQRNLMSHVLGYVGLDNAGLAGIERYFDKGLKGAENKEPLALSIDLRVQNIVNEALHKGMQASQAIGATGMVVDVHSGEILALSNLPDFDPHQNSGANTVAHFNRASLGTYEMGSTFKTFTTAMALEYGVANLNSSFDASHPIHLGRFTIHDAHPENRWLTVPEIYTYSSNIGTVRMIMEIGAKRQQAFLKKLGLMDPLSIEIPEVSAPQYPTPDNWKDINMMTIAYGQGISVTPIHLARAFTAIVNGGELLPLTLRKGGNDGKKGERVISEKTSRQMCRLMRMVVEHGTAKKADVAGYRVGGKTGTAEKASGGGYNKNAKLALFISTFPVDDPKYMVFVIIDEPKPTKATYGFATGGWNAAPVVNEIVSRIGPMLGVAPVYDAVPEDAVNKYWVDNANQKFLHAVSN